MSSNMWDKLRTQYHRDLAHTNATSDTEHTLMKWALPSLGKTTQGRQHQTQNRH